MQPAASRRPWQAAGILLLVAAAVLAVLAFTTFGSADPPVVGSPQFEEYRAQQVKDARTGMAFGLVASFTLLGAFACLQRAKPRAPPP